MVSPVVHYLWPAAGTLTAGFPGGAAARFATSFRGRPIARIFELRLQAQETILFDANIGPYPADAGRRPKASDEPRRIARHALRLPPMPRR